MIFFFTSIRKLIQDYLKFLPLYSVDTRKIICRSEKVHFYIFSDFWLQYYSNYFEVLECLKDHIWGYNSCLHTKVKCCVLVKLQMIQEVCIIFCSQCTIIATTMQCLHQCKIHFADTTTHPLVSKIFTYILIYVFIEYIILSGVEWVWLYRRKNIVVKVDQKCCPEPLPHVFCGLKIQGKVI